MKFFLLALISAVIAAQVAFSGAAAAKKKTPAKPSSKTSSSKSSSSKASSSKSPSSKTTSSKTSSSKTAKKAPTKTATKSTAKKSTSSSRSSSSSRRSSSRRRVVRQPVGQQQPTPERYTEIQQALVDRGYLQAPATGKWGPESVEALKRFEADQSFEPDGKLDSWVLIALGLGPNRASTAGTKAAP